MKKKLIFKTGMVLLVLLALLIVPAAAENYFYFVPQDSSANPDGEVTVELMLHTDENNIRQFQCHIDINPGVVNVTACEDGTNPGWDMWNWILADDPEFGKYLFVYAMEFNSCGPGEIQCGIITFKGVNPGASPLDIIKHCQPGEPEYNPHPTYVVNNSNKMVPFYANNGTFTCTGDDPDTFEKDLVTGWNLVSMPLSPSDNHISAVLSSIDGKYEEVLSYDAGSGFADTTTMDPGNGYFIKMSEDATWTYGGVSYDLVDTWLFNGLNSIGWINGSTSIPDAFASTQGNYKYIARWNANTQSYEVYEPHAPDVFNDFDTMERGVGYLVSGKGAQLTYPSSP